MGRFGKVGRFASVIFIISKDDFDCGGSDASPPIMGTRSVPLRCKARIIIKGSRGGSRTAPYRCIATPQMDFLRNHHLFMINPWRAAIR